jgi:hypothetical protein
MREDRKKEKIINKDTQDFQDNSRGFGIVNILNLLVNASGEGLEMGSWKRPDK